MMEIGRRQPRRIIKPARQDRPRRQTPHPARQNDEHCLGDRRPILRAGRVPGRDGMDQVNIAAHQRGKWLFGFIFSRVRLRALCDYFDRGPDFAHLLVAAFGFPLQGAKHDLIQPHVQLHFR